MERNAIEINFSEACAQADKLEALAVNMKKIANQQLNQTFQELSAAWKGETATAYLSKAERVVESILSAADEINRIGQQVRAKAKLIYNAEISALHIAENRNQ